MKKFLVTIGIIISVFFCTYLIWRYSYYKEFNSVQKEFDNIENVESAIVRVGNYDVTLEEINAEIELTDKTQIGFSSSIFYPSSFEDTINVRINRFNNWKFETHTFRKSGMDDYHCGEDIDFGLYGSMNKLLNIKINNIRDAIKYHNEIAAVIEKIPEYPQILVVYYKGEHSRNYQKFITKYPKDRNIKWKYDKYQDKSDSLELKAIIIK
ncbi:hypothetical protein [Flavobacterium soli]|uniref:hypothetical protein n=1 Tax=Flavobacterium soli TaxID=344881 RepID=UPI00040D82D6|nr:hypothetical protein [Flavobacterium soli]